MAEPIIVTRRTFLVGIVIAILAASLISTVISAKLAVGPQGPKGSEGSPGIDGVDGIDGVNGEDGVDGDDGVNGKDGVNGTDGLDGKSAYEIWLDQGNSGTEQDFLDSLKGEQGPACVFSIENMSGWLPTPAYDSGWLNSWKESGDFLVIDLTHGLNTTEVFVYVFGRLNQTNGAYKNGSIHQFGYGLLVGLGSYGAFWSLTKNRILIYRGIPDDIVSWHEVRVMIWKIAEP